MLHRYPPLCGLSIALFNIFMHMLNTQCLKQRPGSLHCGYYICCMMSNTSAYRRHPNLVSLTLFSLVVCLKLSLCYEILDLNLFSCSERKNWTRKGTYTRMMNSWGSSATFAASSLTKLFLSEAITMIQTLT
jgi:hypothetical protein